MYHDDKKAQEAKQAELIVLAQGAIGRIGVDNAQIATSVVQAFTAITAPQNPPLLIEFTVMNMGRRPRAESRKPGHIILNWRKLVS